MRRKGIVFALLTLGCGGGGYNLQEAEQSIGVIVRTETSSSSDMVAKVVANGATIEGIAVFGTQKITETEVLSHGEGGPNEIQITYIMSSTTSSMALAGEKEDNVERAPLDGLSVRGTLEAGQWQFTLTSGSPTDEQAEALASLAQGYGLSEYPKRELQVGDSWEVDPVTFRHQLGTQWSRVDGRQSMTLDSIVEFEGQKAALILYSMDFQGRLDNEMDGEMSLNGTVYKSLSSGIVLQDNATGQFVLQVEQVENGVPVQVEMSGPMSVEQRSTLR